MIFERHSLAAGLDDPPGKNRSLADPQGGNRVFIRSLIPRQAAGMRWLPDSTWEIAVEALDNGKKKYIQGPLFQQTDGRTYLKEGSYEMF